MPTFYLDTSALLKKYKTEQGSEVIAELFDSKKVGEYFVTSMLTLIETYGVARRMLKNNDLTDQTFRLLLGNINRDLNETVPANKITEDVVYYATEYSREHGLKSSDSLHLGSATVLKQHGFPEPFYFLTSDKDLKSAAKQVDFEVLDPQEQDSLARLRSCRSSSV